MRGGRRRHGRTRAVLLARAPLPARRGAMPAMVRPVVAVLAEDVHRAGDAAPAPPVDRHERAGAHDAARADRARRHARALERQHARRGQQRGRVDGEEAHVGARHDLAGAAALLGQGHA